MFVPSMLVLIFFLLFFFKLKISPPGLENRVISIAPVHEKDECPEMYVVFPQMSLLCLGACVIIVVTSCA